jgi:hypothetical protein
VFTNGQRTRYNGEWLVIHQLQRWRQEKIGELNLGFGALWYRESP